MVGGAGKNRGWVDPDRGHDRCHTVNLGEDRVSDWSGNGMDYGSCMVNGCHHRVDGGGDGVNGRSGHRMGKGGGLQKCLENTDHM